MKHYFLPLAFWAIAFLLAAQAQMIPPNDRVRVEVRATGDTDRKDLKKTSADKVTQNKRLVISLAGKARPNENRVVKWIAYGRNLKSNDLVELESGQAPLALSPSGQQTLESKTITSTYTPEHSVVSGNNNNRRGQLPRAKRVEAEGRKFAGYLVRIMDGTIVVGEAADPVNIDKK